MPYVLQVLRELYHCAFQRGSSIPVPDLIHSLLAVPCPPQGGPKVGHQSLLRFHSLNSTSTTGMAGGRHLLAAQHMQDLVQVAPYC